MQGKKLPAPRLAAISILFGALACLHAFAQGRNADPPLDLSGKPTFVVNEIKPGEVSPLHVHHGEESFYVIEGGTVELPDGKQVPFPTGTTGINRRDVPHGAFKVVGDKPIKYLSVHIVDKGAPLYDAPK